MWISEQLFRYTMFAMIDSGKMRKGVRVMAMLTDEMLLDSYHMAIELKLEREFITLLLAEIHKRNLDTDSISILH